MISTKVRNEFTKNEMNMNCDSVQSNSRNKNNDATDNITHNNKCPCKLSISSDLLYSINSYFCEDKNFSCRIFFIITDICLMFCLFYFCSLFVFV